ncbi:MAG TPA: arsenate reductase ArsC [Candidatus Limnocylindrales bacterium]|nr:arsenate reductase ArsC [Candidatus Limnocylindrales bacterium]
MLKTTEVVSMEKQRVLFVCTHNSARSQMAEGFLRHFAGDQFEVHSAGTEASNVRPLAIRAMAEIGVDISGQESKLLDRYLDDRWDHVVTVCDDANESCPVFPGATNRGHWSFTDPSKAEGTEQERLAVFCKVRDQIVQRVRLFALAAGPRKTPTALLSHE